MFFKNNKQGITPVIAIIVLLVLTIGAAGTAFWWLASIESKLSVEEQAGIVKYGELEGNIKVAASRYDESVNNLILFFENIGSESVPIGTAASSPTTLWVLKNADGNVICSTDWSGTGNSPVCEQGCTGSIGGGETREIILSNFGANALCNIKTQPANSLLNYKVDFSGKAVADGGFVR